MCPAHWVASRPAFFRFIECMIFCGQLTCSNLLECVCVFLTRYINGVKPGEYGVPKPLYFPCLPSYWTGKPKRSTMKEVSRNSKNGQPKEEHISLKLGEGYCRAMLRTVTHTTCTCFMGFAEHSCRVWFSLVSKLLDLGRHCTRWDKSEHSRTWNGHMWPGTFGNVLGGTS